MALPIQGFDNALLRQLQQNQGAQGDQQSFDISSLPPQLQQFIQTHTQDFQEGDVDKIDTPNELKKLMAHVLGKEGMGLDDNTARELANNLDPQNLAALLVEFIKNGGQNPNAPGAQGGGQGGAGRQLGGMPKGNFANTKPGSFGGNPGAAGNAGNMGNTGAGNNIQTNGPATDTSSLKGNTNASKAFNYFVGKGFTPQQAAGIVGNLQAESGVNPGQHQIGGPAFGIAQWEGPRKAALQQFAASRGKSASDLGTQLDFIMHEFNTTEKRAFNAVKSAGTAQEAAHQFMAKFERPGKPHAARRYAFANEAFRQFA